MDDTFEQDKLSILNEPLIKSWAKWVPSILKWIQFGIEVVWICRLNNTMFVKVGNSWPVYMLLFGRRSASFNSSYFIKWCTHINLHKPGIIVFKPGKFTDSKSIPLKLIFFRFRFADKISNLNMRNVFYLW